MNVFFDIIFVWCGVGGALQKGSEEEPLPKMGRGGGGE